MNKAIDICYVISNGFSARMLFQTGLVPKLAAQGKRIAVIVPDKGDANLVESCKKNNIELHEAENLKDFWSDEYKFKRKYYLEDIKANPALWEKHIHAMWYNKSKHPWRRIRPFYYYLIFQLIKIFPFLKKRFVNTEEQYLRSEKITALIKKLSPQLVVSTYPVNLMEARVLYAANQENIKTVIHLLSWDNISCKGHFPTLSDYYIAWGPIMVSELKEYYNIADDKIFSCGVPHFDTHIQIRKNPESEKFVSELDLKSGAPYLFFAMSSPHFAPNEIDIVERLAGKIDENYFGQDMQLIVRPHPQNVTGNMADKTWLGRLANIESERVKVDYPRLVKSKLAWSMQHEDMNRLSNLLAGSSVVMNSGSTVSIDGLMVDRPVIITSFDGDQKNTYWKSARRLIDFTHLRKFVALKGVQVAYNYDDLDRLLNRYINYSNADMDLRKNTLHQECGLTDGKATQRVLEAINKICKLNFKKENTPHDIMA